MSTTPAGELRDGMRVDWDVPIEMDDGVVLRADVYRPVEDGPHPVLLSYGPYAKGLSFQEGYPSAWEAMVEQHPDTAAGSTNKYQNWEVADPEKWVPHGYACVRVDARGTGRSPGVIDHFSPRETHDLFDCVEWAGVQEWSSGKVGLSGISYYAMNQWQVAALRPPHLSAMCVWEGSNDWYRDATHHGGIVSTFFGNWFDMQVKTVQHGLGSRGRTNANTGQLVCGDTTMTEEELADRRVDFPGMILAHPFDDNYHRDRSAVLEDITVPLLSAGNWGGQGLHLRGNVEGYLQAGSPQKWLEMHGIEHWTHYYTDYGVELQRRFFGHFLHGRDTGWAEQPAVQLNIRHVDGSFELRGEDEWPLARTSWTPLSLRPDDTALSREEPTSVEQRTYAADGDGITFLTEPLAEDTELTGPSAVTLFVSSSTTDADIFAVLRVFDPDDREVVFQGAIDPHTPVGQGWLRASHRKLDPERSTPYRPWHTHDEAEPLVPGEVYRLDVEVLPTCLVVPAGYRIGLTIRGRDYVYPDAAGARLSHFKNALTGCGPFLHDDPRDRPAELVRNRVTIHSGPDRPSVLLLPVVPSRLGPAERSGPSA